MRGTTYVFGSSGFLFRSNKLMYDQQTKSLWHHLTGEPVVGPLADSGIKLTVLPIVTTRWRDWLSEHPDTVVLDLNTGYSRDYTPGRPYGVYFASPNTMFPVSPRDDRLSTKAWVFALRLGGQPKAYPLETLEQERVVNDTVGGVRLVIVAAPGARTARAYERGGHTFRAGPKPNEVVDGATGQVWSVEEEVLVHRPSGERLPRLGGHLAYWFGWFAFYPNTLLYGK